jgi:hypothetical protein
MKTRIGAEPTRRRADESECRHTANSHATSTCTLGPIRQTLNTCTQVKDVSMHGLRFEGARIKIEGALQAYVNLLRKLVVPGVLRFAHFAIL